MSGNAITINNGGVNSKLVSRAISRLYCGYANSTALTTTAQGVWARYPDPSVAIETWRVHDFETPTTSDRFTYTGSQPRWFRVDATCNVLKAAGGLQTRTVALQWYLNGAPIGAIREAQMGTDSSIISGTGEVYLQTGDYLEPWITNLENGDAIRLFNCSFNIVEDYTHSFILE